MKKLQEMKSEYEKLGASDTLRQRVGAAFSETRPRFRRTYKIIIAAACFLAVFIGALNIAPDFAYALSDLPVLGPIVQVVTVGRYEAKGKSYSANVDFPQLTGLSDKDVEDKINAELKNQSNTLIAAFDKDLESWRANNPTVDPHLGLDHGYKVLTNDDRYFSVDIYTDVIKASAAETHKFYTVDKKTGKLITLDAYFKPGFDYVTALSTFVKSQMQKENDDAGGHMLFFVDQFKGIKAQQNFYINQSHDLVICFDKYEISIGARGSPSFMIPSALIKEGIAPPYVK